jgi:hypothetical protein
MQQVLVQENCLEDTSRLAQLRLFLDIFMIDPYNQHLVTELANSQTTRKRKAPGGDTVKEAKNAHKDMTFRNTRYKHGQHHQALAFLWDGIRMDQQDPTALGQSLAPVLTNEVAMERELAVDKRLGETRAMRAIDGSELARGEVLRDGMREGQVQFKIGLSTDRLQTIEPASKLIPARKYMPSFYNLPLLRDMFTQCVSYIQGLPEQYSSLLTQDAEGAWILSANPCSHGDNAQCLVLSGVLKSF